MFEVKARAGMGRQPRGEALHARLIISLQYARSRQQPLILPGGRLEESIGSPRDSQREGWLLLVTSWPRSRRCAASVKPPQPGREFSSILAPRPFRLCRAASSSMIGDSPIGAFAGCLLSARSLYILFTALRRLARHRQCSVSPQEMPMRSAVAALVARYALPTSTSDCLIGAAASQPGFRCLF